MVKHRVKLEAKKKCKSQSDTGFDDVQTHQTIKPKPNEISTKTTKWLELCCIGTHIALESGPEQLVQSIGRQLGIATVLITSKTVTTTTIQQ